MALMLNRTCHRCLTSLEANTTNFGADKSRPLGLSYECRNCHRERKKGRDRRKERWNALSPEQRTIRVARMKRWSQSQKGRAVHLRKAYQRIDSCDLTTEEILLLITAPCVYCGTTTYNRGLDRIDNTLPHIKGNVQTACTDCNLVRGNRFTVEEMHLLGRVISDIKNARGTSCDPVRSADHL
jgi:hypothetical protein